MSHQIQFAGKTDRGRVRERNEDAWAAQTETGVFVVSDGMGGHMGGDVASSLVVDTFPELVQDHLGNNALDMPGSAAALRQCVVELSNALRDEGASQPTLHGMGATIVAAVVREGKALIVHMGDSRAYLFRDGHLEMLTSDHSLAEILIASGDITETEAAGHPSRHQITRYVGMAEEPLPETRLVALEEGDQLLLCSDGLHGGVVAQRIGEILGAGDALEEKCERLIAAANEVGGEDNITALLVAV